MRFDVYLVENGYFESRKKASDAVKAGFVSVDGKVIKKNSYIIDGTHDITISQEVCPYVGRGGYKLEEALRRFSVDPKGCVCIDVGASTGGFTDCLLKNGASKVYAVDSGKDQLHMSLRGDSRVVCMEGINARYLNVEQLEEHCDIAVMDVSFISQTLLYEAVASVLKKNGYFISLIKPQFEAGKDNLGKNGIVKDEGVRVKVCEFIKEKAKEYGFENISVIDSPILGGDGNKEFLALFKLTNKNIGEN